MIRALMFGAALALGAGASTSADEVTIHSVDGGVVTSSRDGGATPSNWDDSAVLAGLHPAVQAKVEHLRERMNRLGRRIYLMSGTRAASSTGSMHDQALAVDVTIDYMTSLDVAVELEAEGFPCVIRYYDRHQRPCHMAHGDLRGTKLAKGTYAPGERRALNCPGAAVSTTDTCNNESKAQWNYVRARPDASSRK